MYLSEYYCITQVHATYRIDTKKSVKLRIMLASRFEARRKALQVETSNAKAHADMYVQLT